MQLCKSVRQLHLKDGTIHLHGPRKNPCPVSNKLPAAFISAQQNSSDLVQSTLIPELPADPELTLHSTALVDNDQFPPETAAFLLFVISCLAFYCI